MAVNRDRLALIEDISAIGGDAANTLRETLDKIVAAIAAGMEVEVCSLYLFDAQRERLVLRATVGLEEESVGKVSMRVNEGLVGLVVEHGQPVTVADAISHPRYKYFPETGEERYHAFLGVPVQDGRQKPIGVMVVQTLRSRKFGPERSAPAQDRGQPGRRKSFRTSACARRSRPRKRNATSIAAG